jgi:hypothetical protein
MCRLSKTSPRPELLASNPRGHLGLTFDTAPPKFRSVAEIRQTGADRPKALPFGESQTE